MIASFLSLENPDTARRMQAASTVGDGLAAMALGC
jgi:hypothetical protein